MEKNGFCQVTVSAISAKEAKKISQALVKKKLIAGSLILKGPSSYWWKGKIVNQIYFNVQTFSLMKNKTKIVSEVKKISSDECPCIVFVKIDGNKKFLQWIKESVP